MTSNQQSFGSEGSRGLWLTVAVYAAVLVLLALPIFSVTVPPLDDYPNHLARMHILADYAHSPALQANYVVAWKLAPYLGMDLVIPQLMHFMSVYMAGKVFLFLCLVLFVAGTAAIHFALFGRFSPWPAASALFGYSYVFSLGFANYLFGVGVWLLAFAGWIVLSRGPVLRRIILGSLLSLAVFFSHYFAFLGYGLCVGAYELGVWYYSRERSFQALLRRALAAGCPFLLPLAIAIAVPKGQETASITQYGALSEKLGVLLSPAAFPGARLDMVILLFALVVFAGGLLLGRLRVPPPMRAPLLLLGIVSVAMPNLVTGIWGMDYRFPVVFVYLLIAGSTWLSLPPRVAVPLICAMLVLLTANVGSIVRAWRPIGAQFDEFRAALPVIPSGARVVAFREDSGINPALRHGPVGQYFHLPALAVIERDVYLPFLFKHPMMPVESAPQFKAVDTPHGHPAELADFIAGADPVKGPAMLGETDSEGRHNYWGDWPHHYDYAIELNFGAKPALPPQLELLKSGQIFSIYRIRH